MPVEFIVTSIVALLGVIFAIFEFTRNERNKCIVGIIIAVVNLPIPILSLTMPAVELYPTNGILQEGRVDLRTGYGFQIFYTLDPNKDPSIEGEGIPYEGPFEVKESTQLNVKSNFWRIWGPLCTWELQVASSGEVTSTKGKLIALDAKYIGSAIKSGDSLTNDSFQVKGKLSDGTEVELDDFSIDEDDLSQPGNHTVKITYGSFETDCEVPVINLTKIEATYQGSEIKVNDKLTQNMFRVSATYSDGSREEVNGFIISPEEFSEPGNQNVTVEYKGMQTSCTVTVIENDGTINAKKESTNGIMKTLDASMLSNSGTYRSYLGDDTIKAYAEDQHDAFSINTAADYNMWGGGEQDVSFRIDKLGLSTLKFKICGETGTSGAMTVTVFLDKPSSDENPDYTFELEDAPYPKDVEIDIRNRQTMAIHVSNHNGHENRLVFYDFEGTE